MKVTMHELKKLMTTYEKLLTVYMDTFDKRKDLE